MSFVRVESGVDPVALRDARLRMGLTQHELAADPVACAAGVPELVRFMLGTGQRIGKATGHYLSNVVAFTTLVSTTPQK